MPIEAAATLIGVIMALGGFCWIFINLYEWHCDKKLVKNGTRTTGIITDCVTYPNDDSLQTGQYRFIAEFKDHRNITRFAKSRRHHTNKHKFLNKEISIIYDPEDPNKSRFERDADLFGKVIGSIVACLFGIALFFWGVYHYEPPKKIMKKTAEKMHIDNKK